MKPIKTITLLFTALVLTALPQAAKAEYGDPCGINEGLGYTYDPQTRVCTPYWMDFSDDDGFDSIVQLGVQSVEMRYISGIDVVYWLEVLCVNKKFSVLYYSAPIGMYPDTNLYGNGTGQVKFDNGKPRNIKYARTKSFDGISITDGKAFVRSLMNARNSVSIKVYGIDGPAVATFPKGDFASYLYLFRSAGCSVSK